MTKIMVVYADDIYDADKSLDEGEYREVHQNEYYGVRLSERINWTQHQCLKALEKEQTTIFITNDYYFIRLIQEFSGEEFSIYHADEDSLVHRFIELKPNYALEIGEYIFRLSAREALKRK